MYNTCIAFLNNLLPSFSLFLLVGVCIISMYVYYMYVWGHYFAKTRVSLQTATYKSEGTKYLDILLVLCEEVLHAPTVQIWAQNSTLLLPPNNLLIDSLPFLHYELVTEQSFRIKVQCACATTGDGKNLPSILKEWPIRNGGMVEY